MLKRTRGKGRGFYRWFLLGSSCVEELLKKSGFECIWSKQTTTLGESISKEDCEKFFSVQPEKKEFFVTSKL